MFHLPLQNTFFKTWEIYNLITSFLWVTLESYSSTTVVLLVPVPFSLQHLLSFQTDLASHPSPTHVKSLITSNQIATEKIASEVFSIIHSPNNRANKKEFNPQRKLS